MFGNITEKKRKKLLTKSKEDKIILAISSSRRRSDLGIGINNLAIKNGFDPQDIKAVAKKYGCKIAFGRDIVTNSLNNDKFCEARKAALMREERREKKKVARAVKKETSAKPRTQKTRTGSNTKKSKK